MKRSSVRLLWAVICLVTLPAAASVRGSFERTYQMTGPVDLQVLTRSGDVIVRNGPAGTVTIRGKIFVSDHLLWDRWTEKPPEVVELEKNPPIRQSGNTLNIDYVSAHNISIDFDITVPADTKLTTRTGSGDQTIEGLTTAADLESGSGDMRLHDMAGGLRIHTGSGNIEARDVEGQFSAEAGSGDIRMDAKGQGDVQAHTGSGNVTLRGVNGALHVQTGSGDVNIDGTQAGNWELRTGSGDVEIRLPSDAAFDLDASTSSGDLNVDHPVTMTVQGRVERARHNISGKVRGGGPQLIAHTSSGDLHIY